MSDQMSLLSPAVATGGREDSLRNRIGIVLSFCVMISPVLAVEDSSVSTSPSTWEDMALCHPISLGRLDGLAARAGCELGQ